MKNTLRMGASFRSLKFLTLFLAVSALCFAQTTMTSTTLSAAITTLTQTSVRVASATGITGFSNGQATTFIFVDKELMPVYSVSGTTLVVQRNLGATGLHANSAKVWVGPYNAFPQGGDPAGACTAANQPYLPYVSVVTGNIWNCPSTGTWVAFSTFTTRNTYGATLTAAATIAPSSNFHLITGATTVTTITPPPSFNNGNGCVKFVPTLIGYFTSTGGNIIKGTTTAVGQALEMCYNSATSTWSASY